MKKYAAILFDIDGTLIDLDAVIKAINKALENNNLQKIPKEKIKNDIIGHRLSEILPKVLDVTESQAEEISSDYTNYYLEHHKESEPYPGTEETLKQLREKGLKIGLVTTKKRQEALSTIETYPEIIYDALIGGDDTENVKPSDEPIKRACKELKVNIKETIYVGDHIVDIKAAQNAGCDSVGITTGIHGEDKLKEAKADHIIDKIEEIIPIALSDAEEIEKVVKIPKDRLGVIIGKNGRTKKKIEEKASVKLDIDSKKREVTITRYMGRDPEKSIKATDVVKAIANGFSPPKAFKLLEPNIYIETLDLKSLVGHSNKKIKRVKSRLIGKKGKARRTLEKLTDTHISIRGKKVSIIGKIQEIKLARTGIEKLIEGTPHSGVYSELERKRKTIVN